MVIIYVHGSSSFRSTDIVQRIQLLNLSDPNHFTESNFWKDKADAESALAAAYSPIKGAMYGYFSAFDGWLNLNGRGDDIFTIKGKKFRCGTSQTS